MLRRQLLVGFLAVIVPSTLLLGGVTTHALRSLGRVNAQIVEITHSREAVSDLQITVNQVGAPLGAFLLTGDVGNRRRFRDLLGVAEAKLDSCASAPCHVTTRTPARMVDTLRPAIEQLRTDGDMIFEGGAGGGAARVESVRQAVLKMRGAFEPMLEAVRARGDELLREADAVRWRAWALTVSLTALVALVGGAAAMVIAGRIARPVSELVDGIRRIMAGDWAYQVGAARTGEIGELAASFNRMVRELREHREQLEGHNRALEQRVRERTEELRQAEHALAQSEKLASLGQLAAGVAHELNNPLTSIVMNANLLIEEAGSGSPLAAALRRIDGDAGRCRRIIDDLRAFARRRSLEKVPGEVAQVVGQAAALAAHELDRRGVDLRYDVPADLPKVTWDPDRMVQVVTNLLANAAQAVGSEGGRIVVRARQDDGWLRLEVEDNGVGIPAGQRDRVFDPFFTTKPDGTGLGLSISYGIVNEHGGRIEMESRAAADGAAAGGTGTTMRIVVPVGGRVA
jgi:signal transduction histidine kinase